MITGIAIQRAGALTRVAATSDLAGSPWFFWWTDGIYVGATNGGVRYFHGPVGEQFEVQVLDGAESEPVPTPEPSYSARRTIVFTRSVADDVREYRVYEEPDGGEEELLGTLTPQPGRWEYEFQTGRLNDLTAYTWRVTAVDAAGNESAVAEVDEYIVRRPDAPGFALDFDEGTTEVTVSAA